MSKVAKKILEAISRSLHDLDEDCDEEQQEEQQEQDIKEENLDEEEEAEPYVKVERNGKSVPIGHIQAATNIEIFRTNNEECKERPQPRQALTTAMQKIQKKNVGTPSASCAVAKVAEGKEEIKKGRPKMLKHATIRELTQELKKRNRTEISA